MMQFDAKESHKDSLTNEEFKPGLQIFSLKILFWEMFLYTHILFNGGKTSDAAFRKQRLVILWAVAYSSMQWAKTLDS